MQQKKCLSLCLTVMGSLSFCLTMISWYFKLWRLLLISGLLHTLGWPPLHSNLLSAFMFQEMFSKNEMVHSQTIPPNWNQLKLSINWLPLFSGRCRPAAVDNLSGYEMKTAAGSQNWGCCEFMVLWIYGFGRINWLLPTGAALGTSVSGHLTKVATGAIEMGASHVPP